MISQKLRKIPLFYYLLVAIIITFTIQAIFYINFFRPEERHYLWVAYYSFTHHNWFVLQDYDGIYLNKPPLLFWLINLFWHLFGLSTWAIHLLLAGILLLTLYVAEQLYCLLFKPTDKQLKWACPLIMFSSVFFLQRSTNLSFDILVVCLNLVAFIGIVYSLMGKWRGYWLLGIAIGCNILAKGPICLGFIVPFIIVASFFRQKYHVNLKQWLIGLLLSAILSLIMLSIWFIPLFESLSRHQLYTLMINRAFTGSYGHNSISTYFKVTIVFMLPWLFWPFATRALIKEIYLSFTDKSRWSQRLLLFSFILSFMLLSMISAKHDRYVLTWMFIISAMYFAAISTQQSHFKASFWQGRYINAIFIFAASIGLLVTIISPTPVLSHLPYWAININDLRALLLLLLIGNVALFCLRSSIKLELVRYAGISTINLLVFYILPGAIVSSALQIQALSAQLNQLQQQPACIIYEQKATGYLFHVGKNMIPNGGENDHNCQHQQHYRVDFVANPIKDFTNIIAHYRYTDGKSSITVNKQH